MILLLAAALAAFSFGMACGYHLAMRRYTKEHHRWRLR